MLFRKLSCWRSMAMAMLLTALFAVSATAQNNPVPQITLDYPHLFVSGFQSEVAEGTGLMSTSVMYWDGAPMQTVFATTTYITASVTSAMATKGYHTVTVVNPAPGGGASNAVQVACTLFPPTISNVSPPAVQAASGDLPITVTNSGVGTGFFPDTVVALNGTPLPTTYVSATQLTATIPASLIATAAEGKITAVNSFLNGGASVGTTFPIYPVSPAAGSYVVTGLGALSGDTTSAAWAINNNGLVVGTSNNGNTERGFLWNTFGMTQLPGFGNYPRAINDSAQVAGTYGSFGYLYGQGAFSSIGAVNGGFYSYGYGLNDLGVVCGSAVDSSGRGPYPVSYTTANGLVSYSPLANYAFTYGINHFGEMVGMADVRDPNYSGIVHGFLIRNGATIDLGVLPSGLAYRGSGANAINNLGQIAGYGQTGSNSVNHLILWQGTTLQDLGTLNGGSSAMGNAINDWSQIVGNASTASGNHAFLYTGGLMSDLNSLLPANNGWTLTDAKGINNYGQIAGVGTFGGAAQAYIATPIPQVSSLSPNNANVGGAAFSITVTGGGFLPSSTVVWNGSPRTTVFLSSTKLTAQIAAADIANVGNVPVTVADPAAFGGPVSATSTFSVHVNTSLPTTTATLSGPAGLNGWYKGTVTVSLTATDTASPINATYYTYNGRSGKYSRPFTVTGDGIHPVIYWSTDQAGNVEPQHTINVNIDGTPPVLTLGSVSPAPNAAHWNHTAVSVSFTATDATSGIASVTPASPSLYTAEGVNQVKTVTAVDQVGNTATLTLPAVNIDLTAPVTTPAVTGPLGPDGTYTGPATVSLSATDNLSGVATTYIAVGSAPFAPYTGPVTVSAEGQNVVTSYSVDTAGNTENWNVTVVNIETTGPTTTASVTGPASSAYYGNYPWYTGPATVTLSAFDYPSTVTATYYSVDGGAQQTYTAPFTVPGDGVHTLTYWSVDGAGLTETAHQRPISIDTTAPTVAFGTPSPAPNAAGWNNSAVTLSYTLTDPLSGFPYSQTYNDNNHTVTGSLSFTAENAGQTQYVTATDIVGNSTTVTSPAVNIDLTAPATTATVNGPQVSLAATDGLSGVAATFYTVDGGTAQTYSAPFTLYGSHTVAYWSADVAGNVETPHSTTVTYNPVPTLTVLSPASASAGGPAFTLTLTGTGFVAASSVTWNGSTLTTAYVSPTQITAQVPAANIATSGSATVAVFNPAPGGGTSNALTFSITRGAGLAISSLSPASVIVGAGAQTLTVSGTGFIPTSIVYAGATALSTTYVSSTQLTAIVPASMTNAAASLSITVTNPGTGGGTSRAVTLSVVNATVSAFTFNPTSVKGGTSSTGTVTLTGPAPAAGLSITFNSRTSLTYSPTTLVIPAGTTGGTVTVTTKAVASTTTASINATDGSKTVTGTLTITP